MPIEAYLLIGAIVLLSIATLEPVVRHTFRAYVDSRGARLVVCPETGQAAAVEVAAAHAVVSTLLGREGVRLSTCSRWPEHQDCGQKCRRQIELDPDGCQVRAILDHWYSRRSCVYCGKAFARTHRPGHQPALLEPVHRVTREWRDIPPQTLPAILYSHQPVCWDCHVAESLRKEHPELAVDRPRNDGRPQPPAC